MAKHGKTDGKTDGKTWLGTIPTHGVSNGDFEHCWTTTWKTGWFDETGEVPLFHDAYADEC